eukprot:TRINITY_DN11616_c0_g1_i1.p1 TRINITY_DN11616_c0_g1~~TRINITY_DN11616_c0_g1_i1.p1  ORF type:complete len:981 (-),score=267.86 TRINITY_DN11616_c0_g1_i1:47-2989(-)
MEDPRLQRRFRQMEAANEGSVRKIVAAVPIPTSNDDSVHMPVAQEAPIPHPRPVAVNDTTSEHSAASTLNMSQQTSIDDSSEAHSDVGDAEEITITDDALSPALPLPLVSQAVDADHLNITDRAEQSADLTPPATATPASRTPDAEPTVPVSFATTANPSNEASDDGETATGQPPSDLLDTSVHDDTESQLPPPTDESATAHANLRNMRSSLAAEMASVISETAGTETGMSETVVYVDDICSPPHLAPEILNLQKWTSQQALQQSPLEQVLEHMQETSTQKRGRTPPPMRSPSISIPIQPVELFPALEHPPLDQQPPAQDQELIPTSDSVDDSVSSAFNPQQTSSATMSHYQQLTKHPSGARLAENYASAGENAWLSRDHMSKLVRQGTMSKLEFDVDARERERTKAMSEQLLRKKQEATDAYQKQKAQEDEIRNRLAQLLKIAHNAFQDKTPLPPGPTVSPRGVRSPRLMSPRSQSTVEIPAFVPEPAPEPTPPKQLPHYQRPVKPNQPPISIVPPRINPLQKKMKPSPLITTPVARRPTPVKKTDTPATPVTPARAASPAKRLTSPSPQRLATTVSSPRRTMSPSPTKRVSSPPAKRVPAQVAESPHTSVFSPRPGLPTAKPAPTAAARLLANKTQPVAAVPRATPTRKAPTPKRNAMSPSKRAEQTPATKVKPVVAAAATPRSKARGQQQPQAKVQAKLIVDSQPIVPVGPAGSLRAKQVVRMWASDDSPPAKPAAAEVSEPVEQVTPPPTRTFVSLASVAQLLPSTPPGDATAAPATAFDATPSSAPVPSAGASATATATATVPATALSGEAALQLVYDGQLLQKHIKQGKGKPHPRFFKAFPTGVIGWGTNAKAKLRMEKLLGVVAGPSAGVVQYRKPTDVDAACMFTMKTDISKEVCCICTSASDVAGWVAGLSQIVQRLQAAEALLADVRSKPAAAVAAVPAPVPAADNVAVIDVPLVSATATSEGVVEAAAS